MSFTIGLTTFFFMESSLWLLRYAEQVSGTIRSSALYGSCYVYS